MNSFSKRSFEILAVFAICLSAQADWYVATEANGGNDNNAGTAEAPFLTISKGVSRATTDDYIVHVGPGEFPITAQIKLEKKVLVIGAGRDRTTVLPVEGKSCTRGFYLNHAEAELACIRVTGMTGVSPDGGMGATITANGGTVRDCLLDANSDRGANYGSKGTGLMMAAGKTLRTIISNNISGQTAQGGDVYGGGIYMTGGVLESCLVAGNNCTGSTKRHSQGGGIYATGGRIVNCTVTGNTSAGDGGGICIASGSPEIVNTIVIGNASSATGADFFVYDGYDSSLTTHCASFVDFGTDPIADVELADRTGGGYWIPAGWAGSAAGLVEGVDFESETDIEGRARVFNGTVDLGCYQLDTSVPRVGVRAERLGVGIGESVTLAAVGYAMPAGNKTYSWTVKDGAGDVTNMTGETVTYIPLHTGYCEVAVSVRDASTQVEIANETQQKVVYAYARNLYVESTGNDGNDGLGQDTAFASVASAVDAAALIAAAANHDTLDCRHLQVIVHVGVGDFTETVQSRLTAPVVVRGAGADKTFIGAPAKLAAKVSAVHTTFILQHDEAVLEDLTVWKGNYDGYDSYGVGVYMEKGTVRNATICRNVGNNWRIYGAGIYMKGGLVDHCVISNNENKAGARYGGGIAMTGGRVENSLIVGNDLNKGADSYTGAGVWMSGGTLANCTVAGNKTGRSGAGVYVSSGSPQIVNCLIADNLNNKSTPAEASDIDYYNGYDTSLIDHCAIPGCEVGVDTKTGSVDMKADYTVEASSSAIDAGRDDYAYASEGDLAGNDRKIGLHVDAGCFEYDTSGYSVSFAADKEAARCGETVTLTPTVLSPSDESALTYAWTVASDLGVVSNYTDRVVETAFDVGGRYTVSLVVTDPRKGETSAERIDYLHIVTLVRYVATEEDGGSDDNNGQTPEAPFLTVAKAVGEAKAEAEAIGDVATVHVAAGTYPQDGSIVLDRGVCLLGAGADVCTLTTSKRFAHGVQLNHADAVLSGFTVKGFRASSHQQEGIGVHLAAGGGTVRDCVIEDNGILSNSDAYHVKGGGAKIENGTMIRCRISGNTVYNGYCEGAGVSISGGRLESCLIEGNRLVGASDAATAGRGGGVLASGGEILGCTIVGNSTPRLGGGVAVIGDSVVLANSVIYGNTAGISDDEVLVQTETPHVGHCFTGAEIGEEPILGAPEFRDFANGDYALLATSDLIDAGDASELVSLTDLAGNSRISGEAVDVGCYELDQSVFCCCGKAAVPSVNAYDEVNFSSRVFGAPSGANLSYAWTVDNGEGIVSNYTGAAFSTAFDYPGNYTVTLTVTDSVSGEHVSEARAGYLYIVSLDRYVSPTGDDGNSGLDPEHPFGTLATAVAKIREVADGAGRQATLHLAPGTYPIAGTLKLSSAVCVRGENRDTTFVLGAADFGLAFNLSHDDAVLSGVTVTNIVSSRGDQSGVGLYLSKGEVRDCRVAKCSSGSSSQWRGQGAGIYMTGGAVRDTIIENCTIFASSRYGAGVYMKGGTVERCLIRNNFFPKFVDDEVLGGGVYMTGGTLRNCSIVLNSTEKLAGGVYAQGANTVVENCLIAGNVAWEDDCDTAPDFRAGATFAATNLRNCFIGRLADAFVDENQVPLAGSPLIAAGIGWKQFAADEPTVGFATDRTEALAGSDLTFTGAAYGAEPGAFSWIIRPPEGAPIEKTGASFTASFDQPGVYGVTLAVAGVGEVTRASAFRVGAKTIALEDGGDLASAVEDAVDGTVIMLAPGTYALADELVVDKKIDIVGAGRDTTRISRDVKGDGIFRVLRWTGGGTLSGVTVSGGHFQKANGYLNQCFYGAGVWLTGRGGLVADCRITGNSFAGASSQQGAGLTLWSEKGRVTRTLIDGNAAGASNSQGGGAYVYAGLLDNCIVLTNSAVNGGGIWIRNANAKVANCVIAGNAADTNGGGLHLGGNAAAEIENCVFVGNTSSAAEFVGAPQWSAASYPLLTNAVKRCAFVGSDFVGEGSFACADAKFSDAASGDYRIALDSPLRFKGLCETWMEGTTDFYGNRRVVSKRRVDIGCHQTPGNGMVLLVK